MVEGAGARARGARRPAMLLTRARGRVRGWVVGIGRVHCRSLVRAPGARRAAPIEDAGSGGAASATPQSCGRAPRATRSNAARTADRHPCEVPWTASTRPHRRRTFRRVPRRGRRTSSPRHGRQRRKEVGRVFFVLSVGGRARRRRLSPHARAQPRSAARWSCSRQVRRGSGGIALSRRWRPSPSRSSTPTRRM